MSPQHSPPYTKPLESLADSAMVVGMWQPIETAPTDARVLVNFTGAGPVVAYRDPEYPEMWVRYLGFGKSTHWPTVHGDYATHWMPLPPSPT